MGHSTSQRQRDIEGIEAGSVVATVSLRYWENPNEVVISDLPEGARFRCYFPGGNPAYQDGTLIYVNASRARIRLRGEVEETNWPNMIRVEPMDWEQYDHEQAEQRKLRQKKEKEMADQKLVEAAGLQARYDYWRKMLAAAEGKQDEPKMEVATKKIEQLIVEAGSKGVNLIETSAKTPAAPAPAPTKTTTKPTPTVKPHDERKIENKVAAKMERAAQGESDKGSGKTKAHTALRTHDCLCNCGRETQRLFAPGHDARVKGIILKVERGLMKREDIPDPVQPFVKYKGTWGSDNFTLTAAPVRIPGRPEVADTSQEALEALDV